MGVYSPCLNGSVWVSVGEAEFAAYAIEVCGYERGVCDCIPVVESDELAGLLES